MRYFGALPDIFSTIIEEFPDTIFRCILKRWNIDTITGTRIFLSCLFASIFVAFRINYLSLMHITTLSKNEWKQFRDIRLEALKNDPLAFGSTYKEGLQKTDEEWQLPLTKETSHLLFAKDGDEVIGMIASYQDEGEKCKHVAYVWGVYVRELYRGKGIAKKLFEVLFEKLKALHVIKINLNVNTTQEHAKRLYESLGFETVGTAHKEMYINGGYYDEYLMEKIL